MHEYRILQNAPAKAADTGNQPCCSLAELLNPGGPLGSLEMLAYACGRTGLSACQQQHSRKTERRKSQNGNVVSSRSTPTSPEG